MYIYNRCLHHLQMAPLTYKLAGLCQLRSRTIPFVPSQNRPVGGFSWSLNNFTTHQNGVYGVRRFTCLPLVLSSVCPLIFVTPFLVETRTKQNAYESLTQAQIPNINPRISGRFFLAYEKLIWKKQNGSRILLQVCHLPLPLEDFFFPVTEMML